MFGSISNAFSNALSSSIGNLASKFIGGAAMFAGGPFGFVASQIFTSVASEIFSRVVDQLPLPDWAKDGMNSAFDSYLGGQYGSFMPFGDMMEQLQQLLTPMQYASVENDINNTVSQCGDLLTNSLNHNAKEASRESGEGGEGDSWLEALARALGEQVGNRAQLMMDANEEIQGLKTGNKGKHAQEFTKAQTEFQVQSQMFGMMSETASNVIKTVGEAMSTMARKQ